MLSTANKQRWNQSTCTVNNDTPVDDAGPVECTLSFDREHSRYELRYADIHKVFHITTASNVSGLTDLEITQAGDDRPLLSLDLPSKVLSLSMSHISSTLPNMCSIDFLVSSAIFVAMVEDDVYTTTARRSTRRLPGLLNDPLYSASPPRRVVRASWRNKGSSTQATTSNTKHHVYANATHDTHHSSEGKPTPSASTFSLPRFNGYILRKLNSNDSKIGSHDQNERAKHGKEPKATFLERCHTPKGNNDEIDNDKNKKKKKRNRSNSEQTLASINDAGTMGQSDYPELTRANTMTTVTSTTPPSHHTSIWDEIRMSLRNRAKKSFFTRMVTTSPREKIASAAATSGRASSSCSSSEIKSQQNFPLKLPPALSIW